jgi:hypothetical protein
MKEVGVEQGRARNIQMPRYIPVDNRYPGEKWVASYSGKKT